MKRSIGFVSVLMFLISACATTTVEQPQQQVVVEKKPEPEAEAPTIEAIRGYTPTESEVKSLEIFKEIQTTKGHTCPGSRSFIPGLLPITLMRLLQRKATGDWPHCI
jgi:hypothetical protein